jgi:hypothetical protein
VNNSINGMIISALNGGADKVLISETHAKCMHVRHEVDQQQKEINQVCLLTMDTRKWVQVHHKYSIAMAEYAKVMQYHGKQDAKVKLLMD